MAAITCVSCNRPLRVPEAVLGGLVQCPLCLDEFIAQTDPVAEAAVRAVEAPRKRAAVKPQPIAAPVREAPEKDVEEFEEADAWTETMAQAAPPEAPARESAPVRALFFQVLVARDPDRILRGRMDAELTADGLYLRKARQALAFAAIGGKTRYLGANRLIVTVEGREVELTVVKPWTSVYHLAQDTAGFLGGASAFPDGRAYDIPWYLYALPTIFAVLPFAACPFDLLADGGFGVLLWCSIAIGLAFAAFVCVAPPRHMPRTRLVCASSIVGLGVLIYLFAFFAKPSDSVDASLWRTYVPPDGGFRVKLPGSPIVTRNRAGAFIADPDEDTVSYTLDVKEPEVRFIVADSPAVTTEVGLNQLPGGNINNKAGNDAKMRLQQEFPLAYPGVAPGYAKGKTPIYGLPYYYVTYQTGPDLAGRFTATNRTLEAYIYIAPGRTYTLIVVGPNVRAHSPDALKFFESFQIIPPIPGGGW